MTSRYFEEQLQVGHYSRSPRILLVGEGHFAFSSMLASSFGSAPNIYATSRDSYETFCARYGADGVETVRNLKARRAQVYFDVDITTAATNCNRNVLKQNVIKLLSMKFDRVIFNFPHAGYLHELQPFSARFYYTQHHENLILTFFKNVSEALLDASREIHITHKTTVYKRWKFNRSARLCGLSLKRSLLFVPESFSGYVPCRGAGKHWIPTFPLGQGTRTYIYGMDWSSPLRNIQCY